MGVIFAKPAPKDSIVGVAWNAERHIEDAVEEAVENGTATIADPTADAADEDVVTLDEVNNGGNE